MSDLLIVYEMNPEKVFSFVITSENSKYELLKQANGLLVNVNDEKYPPEVVSAVANLEELIVEPLKPSAPLHIVGDFLVIHCGFAL